MGQTRTDAMRRMRSYADALVEDGPVRLPDGLPLHQPKAPWRWWSRRLVAGVASAATLLGGNAGMALAADGAAPGDLLYALDRGYERVAELTGFGRDHSAERLEEAAVMIERDRPVDALHLVAEALREEPAGLETSDVGASIDEIADDEPAESSELTSAVAELVAGTKAIREIARSGESPVDAAREISELARAVADAARDQGGPDRPPGRPPTESGAADTSDSTPGDGRSEVRPGDGKPPSTPAGPPTSTP